MIVLVHNNQKVISLHNSNERELVDYDSKKPLVHVLFETAKFFPKELIIWVHHNYKESINLEKLDTIFHHKLIMASYAVNGQYAISEHIGYVEQKPYTNASRNVCFPTWLMSSDVGGIYAETLNEIKNNIGNEIDFDYALSSIAKQAMPKGLFCYSEPLLIHKTKTNPSNKKEGSTQQLFKFVKQHYKFIWSINLLFCFIIFEHKIPFFSFFKSLFYKPFNVQIDLSNIEVSSQKEEKTIEDVDVIIPTLGRKECLYNVLRDFSVQTVLPKKIIIVEQNADKSSFSELDYIMNEKWPFVIEHYFIHQTGVCNARNLALSKVKSEWVILGDDDNRFGNDLIKKFFNNIKKYRCSVATTTYLKPNEPPKYFYNAQTDIFGSGNTMLKSSLLNQVQFDMSFEFGYGEDSDFGMQLRKAGHDIIFFPDIKITHLKAPIGGFRTKVKQLWEDENIQPKPSPTIMLFAKKHYNQFQIRGYKFVLFVKFYRKQNIKNPFKYIKTMQKSWEKSMYWSEQLTNNQNA